MTGTGQAGRGPFPPAVIAEVKAIVCELPAARAVPLSRFSVADVRQEAIACGLVEQVRVRTVWRWLDEDALKPWRHRSWIVPRVADFAAKAGVVLDVYRRWVAGERLGPDELVISADEKTSIQARCRRHPTRPPAGARAVRVEHEDERGGVLAYLVAWDVHRARLFGHCRATTGIAPLGRLVEQVMASEPYASAMGVFWVVDNGSSQRGQASIDRPEGTGRTCGWCSYRSTRPGCTRSRSTCPSARGRSCPQRLRRSCRGRAPPARLPAPLGADRGPVCLVLYPADLERLLGCLAGEERLLAVA